MTFDDQNQYINALTGIEHIADVIAKELANIGNTLGRIAGDTTPKETDESRALQLFQDKGYPTLWGERVLSIYAGEHEVSLTFCDDTRALKSIRVSAYVEDPS
jgi:hypothetical protein